MISRLHVRPSHWNATGSISSTRTAIRFGTNPLLNDPLSPEEQQKQKEQALRAAVRNLDDTTVLALLEEGMTPTLYTQLSDPFLNENASDAEGKATLILEATLLLGNRPQSGYNIVKALLEKGANPFANDRRNRNAFLMACVRLSRAEDEYLPLIQMFLDYARQNQPAKDPDLFSQGLNWLARHGQGRTPENQQRLLAVAEELLNNGANPNFLVSLNKFDTLQLASMGLGDKSPKLYVRGPRDWPEMVQLLLTPRNNMSPPVYKTNVSPVTLAGSFGHADSLRVLLNAMPEQERPWAMQKALHYGILNNSQGTIELLLPAISQMPIAQIYTATGTSENTPCNLLLACLRAGNFSLFERILDENPALVWVALQSNLLHGLAKGVYPPRDMSNWPFPNQPRPNLEFIHISGYDTEQDINGLKTIPSPERIEKLLDWLDETLPESVPLKSILNKPDQKQYTPLMYAAERGFLPTIRQLIDAGADPSYSNNASESALSLYLKAQEKLNLPSQVHQTIITLLTPNLPIQNQ
jgi:hypothetical protein